MKRASFLERFRFSYTYALLHESVRSLQGRFRPQHRLQFTPGSSAVKLERRQATTGQASLASRG